MKPIRHILLPLLTAVLLLLSVRGLLLTHITLPADSSVQGKRSGRNAFVSLTYYGLRLPGEQLWGYHRFGKRIPRKGDPLVFNLPYRNGHPLRDGAPVSAGDLCAGICRALPGDTVWVDTVGRKFLSARHAGARPLVIPGQQRSVRVTPENAALLAHIMTRYENSRATIDAHGRLTLGGQALDHVTLLNDYYWVEIRPEIFLLVPHSALLGKIIGNRKPSI